jgi:chorismate mutase
MNFSSGISLEKLREELIRCEDLLIFTLIERAQFKQNLETYVNNYFTEINCSFLDYFLHEVEIVHSKVRRYTSPDEYPFTANLPPPIIPAINFPKTIHKNDINVNSDILNVYKDFVIPMICQAGSDGNVGSCATKDVEALQILSRRIHMGKFVAGSYAIN